MSAAEQTGEGVRVTAIPTISANGAAVIVQAESLGDEARADRAEKTLREAYPALPIVRLRPGAGIGVLSAKPGDVVLLTMPPDAGQEQTMAVARAVQGALPGHPVLVLPDFSAVGAMSAEQATNLLADLRQAIRSLKDASGSKGA